MVRTVTSSVERAVRLQVKSAYGRASIRRQTDKRRCQIFFKKKCPNCGAKNPEGLKACAICGAPFALRQIREQLKRRKGATPAWPEEVEKEAEITCPKCGTLFQVSHEDEAIICPNIECRAVSQTTRYEERLVFEGKATIQGSDIPILHHSKWVACFEWY